MVPPKFDGANYQIWAVQITVHLEALERPPRGPMVQNGLSSGLLIIPFIKFDGTIDVKFDCPSIFASFILILIIVQFFLFLFFIMGFLSHTDLSNHEI